MNNTEKKIGSWIFKKYDNFWLSNIIFNKNESTFEVFNQNLNDTLIEQINSKINSTILELNNDGNTLLKTLSHIFWGNNKNTIFTFTGFVIDDATKNLCIDFRMCYHCSGNDNFSDYANWYIDIKEFKIVGCSRVQL